MKTIDLRKSFVWAVENRDSLFRTVKNVHVGYKILRLGSTATLPVHPVMIYCEALISLFEAVNAYFGYRRAAEKTKQLSMQLETLRVEIENLRAQSAEMIETEKQRLDNHAKVIVAQIGLQRKKEGSLMQIYEHTGKHLGMIKSLILEQRANHMYSDEIKDLEIKYLQAIRARINITLQITGG